MEKIGDILQRKYSDKSALTVGQMQSLGVCNLWEKVLGEIEEKYISESKALSFKDGLLTVGVTHSSMMMELQFLDLVIREKFTEILGEEKIVKIKYKIGMS